MNAHTKGRWVRNGWPHGNLLTEDGRYIAHASTTEDADRIVQCVNGWDALAAERDALRAMLERACNAVAQNHEGGRAPTADEIWARFGNEARALLSGKGGAS